MANTYTSLHYHIVFSTKRREPWLLPEIRTRLFPYLAGAAREHGLTPLEIGGVADHIHLLLRVPASTTLSKSIQLIKGGSSYWIKEAFPHLAGFAWQDGYGAFTVSQSLVPVVQRYVRDQESHHKTTCFADEYRRFLEEHRIEFDERYLLG